IGTRHPVRGAWRQPPSPSQASHSGQVVTVPPAHVPAAQVSPLVQVFASLHGVPSGSLQLSTDSLQVWAHWGPPAHGSPACTVHAPRLHVSGPLQKTPSEQGAVLFGCVQVPPPSHTSSVQPLPSPPHVAPGASYRQLVEQQSPERTLPSSQ